MPHCIIEYTSGLESRISIDHLVDQVHAGVLAVGIFPEETIKTRAVGYSHFRVGATRNAFIHVTARILTGALPDQYLHLSSSIGAALQVLPVSAAITVEVVEIDQASFFKVPN